VSHKCYKYQICDNPNDHHGADKFSLLCSYVATTWAKLPPYYMLFAQTCYKTELTKFPKKMYKWMVVLIRTSIIAVWNNTRPSIYTVQARPYANRKTSLQTFVNMVDLRFSRQLTMNNTVFWVVTPCSLEGAHCSSKTSGLFKHNNKPFDLNRTS
jgi:hypothetical protein